MSPYAVSKLAGEYYCDVFARQYALPVSILRFFNVYGPRQSASTPYPAVIPAFIDSASRGAPLITHGDGLQTRDFTYVDDVVHACVIAAVRGARGVFNVAAGCPVSIDYLAHAIIDLIDSSSTIIHAPARKGDVRDSAADIGRLVALGYQPRIDILEGLALTIDWARRLSPESSNASAGKSVAGLPTRPQVPLPSSVPGGL